MQGSWNNGKPHYRCVYPEEYALANHVHHPRSVYVREELIVPHLDRGLARAFTPSRLPVTIAALTAAQDDEAWGHAAPRRPQPTSQVSTHDRISAGSVLPHPQGVWSTLRWLQQPWRES
jgi:hypothetical protein